MLLDPRVTECARKQSLGVRIVYVLFSDSLLENLPLI